LLFLPQPRVGGRICSLFPILPLLPVRRLPGRPFAPVAVRSPWLADRPFPCRPPPGPGHVNVCITAAAGIDCPELAGSNFGTTSPGQTHNGPKRQARKGWRAFPPARYHSRHR